MAVHCLCSFDSIFASLPRSVAGSIRIFPIYSFTGHRFHRMHQAVNDSHIITPVSSKLEYCLDGDDATHAPIHIHGGGGEDDLLASESKIHHCAQLKADVGYELLRCEDVANIFDSLYMITVHPSLNPHQDQENFHHLGSIFGPTPKQEIHSENPVRRFTGGVPTKSVDPARLPPPNRLMRRRSRVAV